VSAEVAAFFDVDGTLTHTTTLEPLFWYQRARLPRWRFVPWAAGLLLQVPFYWAVDKCSRGAFNVVFYRRYRGLRLDDLRRWHRETFGENLRRAIFPAALECVRDHQRRGHRVVLVTGAADFVMQPLAEHVGATDLIAMRLEEQGGVCTGRLGGPPIAGAQKALLLRGYAQMHGIDLAASFAYADSISDAAMLECVGHPVAVRPGRRLRRLAGARGWRVAEWGTE
jgi:HAD superfamily hydrolase (TIGR01490 family)